MKTADVLIVIDMQNGVCYYEDQVIGNFDQIVPRINERIEEYASIKKPIVFVQHIDDYLEKGSKKWEILPKLNSSRGDSFVEKKHPNSFYQTNLKEVLENYNAESIEICGAETQYCVDSTVKFAHGLGYSVYMQKGLHAAWDSELMTADKTIRFYENIWDGNFVTFI